MLGFWNHTHTPSSSSSGFADPNGRTGHSEYTDLESKHLNRNREDRQLTRSHLRKTWSCLSLKSDRDKHVWEVSRGYVRTEQIVPSRSGSHTMFQLGRGPPPSLGSRGATYRLLSCEEKTKKSTDSETPLLLRLLLLPSPAAQPSSCNNNHHATLCRFGTPAPCYAKSTVEVYNPSGSATVEMVRLGGQTSNKNGSWHGSNVTRASTPDTEHYHHDCTHHFRLYVTATGGSAHITLPSDFRGAIFVNSSSTMTGTIHVGAGLRQSIDGGLVRLDPLEVREGEDELQIFAAEGIAVDLAGQSSRSSSDAGVGSVPAVWDVDNRRGLGRVLWF